MVRREGRPARWRNFEAIADLARRDMSVGQADNAVAGRVGHPVKVAVVRPRQDGASGSKYQSRGDWPQHVVADRVADDVAYVRLPALETMDVTELRDKLVQFDKQGLHKLVLDLRDCTRGQVPDAITAAQFLPLVRQNCVA